ncbi:matrixin family metalloprotease [Lactiplantibacillus modestisalitolerans]
MITMLVGLALLISGSVVKAAVTPFGRNRWPRARVTYVIRGSAYDRRVFQTAIAAWNATGKFRFVAGSNANHQVTLMTSRAMTGLYYRLAGITFTTSPKAGYFSRARVLLLTRNLTKYHYSYWDQVHVAEHELGHVMGLNHSRAPLSVMRADNRYNGISHGDQTAVKLRYQLPVGER